MDPTPRRIAHIPRKERPQPLVKARALEYSSLRNELHHRREHHHGIPKIRVIPAENDHALAVGIEHRRAVGTRVRHGHPGVGQRPYRWLRQSARVSRFPGVRRLADAAEDRHRIAGRIVNSRVSRTPRRDRCRPQRKWYPRWCAIETVRVRQYPEFVEVDAAAPPPNTIIRLFPGL
jgi:hypothetical protein